MQTVMIAKPSLFQLQDNIRHVEPYLPYSQQISNTVRKQQESCASLHTLITSNLPYYKALAKLQNRRLLLPHTFSKYKNLCLLSRLTVSGLSVMQMQFVKKPKNPV